ncbi:MAG: YbhB/YbcL family Raf kinase inhibitor-like protein [Planctomycetes bacterium]|nr:YbhB/YbcL family Raf kinase inhibitor-like protein [Planctomycetota bacterium]
MAEVEIAVITVSSPGFEQGGAIPREHTADGSNVSPALQWTDVPYGTRSIALVCVDPDAPGGSFVHWVIFNIDASTTQLPRGIPASAKLADGALQGRNGFGKIGYGGPAPPKGPSHRYFFKVYALDTMLDLGPGCSHHQLMQAIAGHIHAEGELMGKYGR